MAKLDKDEEFAARFRRLVADKGWQELTRIELGKKLGVTGPCVQFYLSGERLPGMTQAKNIAAVFGVCVEWLLSGLGPMSNSFDDSFVNVSHLDRSQRALLSIFIDAMAQPAQPAQPAQTWKERRSSAVHQKSH